MRILLVEDNAHDIETVLRTFQGDPARPSFTVDVVQDGESALQYMFDGVPPHPPAVVNGRRPHLILLDLKLQGIQGIDVLRRLKEDTRSRMIPVVVLTGYRGDAVVAECYDLGVNSYVVKPQDGAAFSQALRSVARYWTRLNEPPSY